MRVWWSVFSANDTAKRAVIRKRGWNTLLWMTEPLFQPHVAWPFRMSLRESRRR